MSNARPPPAPPPALLIGIWNIKISIISIINFNIINMLWYPANLVFQFSQAVLSMICGSSDQTTKLRASVLRLRQQVIQKPIIQHQGAAHKS